MTFPAINKLKSLQSKHQLEVEKVAFPSSKSFFKVVLKHKDGAWPLHLHDEYGDFTTTNQLLCIDLVLRTLEDYKEADDYLIWCQQYGLDPSKWLDYFTELAFVYNEIESNIGPLAPAISSWDYQLRAGSYAYLLGL